jgi:hypothetical protein
MLSVAIFSTASFLYRVVGFGGRLRNVADFNRVFLYRVALLVVTEGRGTWRGDQPKHKKEVINFKRLHYTLLTC